MFRYLMCLTLIVWSPRIAWCADPAPVPPIDSVPVASIVVSDSAGHAITDEVAYGQMIVVTSEKAVCGVGKNALIWSVKPQLQTYQTPDARNLILTMPMSDATVEIMQIVAKGDVPAYQVVKIKCGKGSQPPPPDPTPGPTPPTASKLFLSVVEDAPNRTPETAIVLNAMSMWNQFRVDGHDWRFFDLRSSETKGKKAIADALKANIPPPALVVSDLDTGKVLTVVKLPSVADVPGVVAKFSTGGK